MLERVATTQTAHLFGTAPALVGYLAFELFGARGEPPNRDPVGLRRPLAATQATDRPHQREQLPVG